MCEMQKKGLFSDNKPYILDKNLASLTKRYTVCPRSSDPILFGKLLYEMGHYFLDIQYD